MLAEFPEAQTTIEIAQQLAPYLPITSTEEIAGQLEGVITVGGQPFPIERIAEQVPRAVYPIESLDQLVEIVAFAVRIAPSVNPPEAHVPQGLRAVAAKLSRVGFLQGATDLRTVGEGRL
ncbi:hypothetical protein ACQR3Z_33015 [Nocardia fluminea]